ncbi:MAG: hypothetical protein JJT93_09550 [Gammaproteobacteria bacterium]|nr:hypothetical protein [Gammaproteobacteria bacterium]TVQ47490.1 MAG: hypothetical protein EA371_08335 [Gammaproteobacteria bacterium]
MSEKSATVEQALETLARTLRESAERIAALEEELAQTKTAAAEVTALREALQTRDARLTEQTERCKSLGQELEDTLTQLRRADEKLAARDLDCARLEERHLLDNERLESLRAEMSGLRLRARWANRRRRLAGKLVAELRQRQRANLSLKNGIDALRQFKNKAEEEHRALLERYRRLQESMRRGDEEPAKPAVPHDTHRVVDADDISPSGLHRRLLAQGELIESMERDIQRVAALKRDLMEREQRVGELDARVQTLEQELELKQSLIATLEDDLNNTMRSRRIDPRLLSDEGVDPDATFAAEHGHSEDQASRQATLTAGLSALEAPRPQKRDTGTVKLRVLPEVTVDDEQTPDPAPPRRTHQHH